MGNGREKLDLAPLSHAFRTALKSGMPAVPGMNAGDDTETVDQRRNVIRERARNIRHV